MAKIIGNTTATPNPRPDWNQTDETKANYVENKPAIQNGSGENSIQQGTNTQAITIDSSASGSGTIAGSFGYRITQLSNH